MIDFDQAIEVTKGSISKLIPNAKQLTLESVLISDNDQLFEVTFSYLLEKEPTDSENNDNLNNLAALARIMGKRREHKVFLIDKATGQFKGFKTAKNDR